MVLMIELRSVKSALINVILLLMWLILSNVSVEARRYIPNTSYPFSRRNSARYEPSWPVIPVINAFFIVVCELGILFKCSFF